MSSAPSPAPHPPAPQNTLSVPTAKRQKPLTIGIAAGAEDAKYHSKYKELKRKVKDIEAENDKLHFKVLQTKLSIRRMKMERAVLYERLSAVPPSPARQDRLPLPPAHPVPGGPPPHQHSSRPGPASHQHRDMRDHPSSMDSDQPLPPQEYIRPQGNPRGPPPAPDTHSVSSMDGPPGSAVALSPHMSIHSPRRISSGHETSRHHMPPVGQILSVHPNHYENSRSHSHSNSHASPPLHHAHPDSSHSRDRSHSASRSRQHVPPPSYRGGPANQQHHYPESLPPVHHTMHSPPISDRDRPRRGDTVDYASSHPDSHPYERQMPLSPRAHPPDSRSSSSRIHSHQRLGPGTYISREEFQDKQQLRDMDRVGEWEREHDRSRDYHASNSRSREISSSQIHSPPHSVHRSRSSQMDRGDYDPHVPPRSRDDPSYYHHDTHISSSYPRLARSDTPGSGSGSGSGGGVPDVPSRPDSRTQYYSERDRARPPPSYRLRPVGQPSEDVDFAHEDGRSSQTRNVATDRNVSANSSAPLPPVGGGASGGNFSMSEQSRPTLDSRKRSRNDMEVDSDNDIGPDGPSSAATVTGGNTLYGSSRLQDDRSSKRYHRDHHSRRSIDNYEESRMGPP